MALDDLFIYWIYLSRMWGTEGKENGTYTQGL